MTDQTGEIAPGTSIWDCLDDLRRNAVNPEQRVALCDYIERAVRRSVDSEADFTARVVAQREERTSHGRSAVVWSEVDGPLGTATVALGLAVRVGDLVRVTVTKEPR